MAAFDRWPIPNSPAFEGTGECTWNIDDRHTIGLAGKFKLASHQGFYTPQQQKFATNDRKTVLSSSADLRGQLSSVRFGLETVIADLGFT
jgi:hypothetical protein